MSRETRENDHGLRRHRRRRDVFPLDATRKKREFSRGERGGGGEKGRRGVGGGANLKYRVRIFGSHIPD